MGRPSCTIVFGMRTLLLSITSVAIACSDGAAPFTPVPAQVEARSLLDQRGAAGAPANEPPSVRVLSADGRPVANVVVTFAASAGAVVPPSVMTGADGLASAAWTLPQGPGEVRATAGELAPVVFKGTGGPRTFDLTIRWQTPPPGEALRALQQAEQTLERIIWEELPDVSLEGAAVCPLQGVPAATLSETVDDVLVLARIGPMDGPGGAGAQGFPCLIRDPGTQTIVGFIRFDEDDYPTLTEELRREFALHELVHALGFVPALLNITTPTGFTRSCLQLPSSGSPNTLVQDTHFSCEHAVRAFDRIGGMRYAGLKVPLENGGTRPLGANTLNHHWRKSSLERELMTGWFVAGQPAPLSLVTVGALEDLSYGVVYDAAEPMTLAPVIAGTVRGPTSVMPVELPPPVASLHVHRSGGRTATAIRDSRR